MEKKRKTTEDSWGITERKQAENNLQESEKKYRLITENIVDTVTIQDMDLRFTYVSPSIKRLRGFTVAEAMEQQLDQVVTSESMRLIKKVLEEEMALEVSGTADLARTRTFELEEYKKDGSTIWVEITVSYIRDQEQKPVGLLSVTRGIAERKLAENELKQILSKLRRSLAGTVDIISQIVEMRDPYTSGHQKKVSHLARKIGQKMGLPNEQIEEIRLVGLIHDIGKIVVPSEILSKPTKLSLIEFSLIKAHVQLGFDVLEKTELSQAIKQAVFQHHERLDGSGYPQGLKGKEILLEARILAVADVVEAMASHRPYRASLGIDVALAEIVKNKSILYDPMVVDTCLAIINQGYKFDD
jgi:PAS domain S-box-containing protein/putative nucleotidyltransferase with HDIG domain